VSARGQVDRATQDVRSLREVLKEPHAFAQYQTSEQSVGGATDLKKADGGSIPSARLGR